MDHYEGVEIDVSGGVWTDERHASFLNRMEESFIRAMIGSGDAAGGRRDPSQRHLLESTAESGHSRGHGIRPHRASGSAPLIINENGAMGSTSRRAGRKPVKQSDLEDQVVPELGGAMGDGVEGKNKNWRRNRNL
ncbi:putative cold-regulated protein [Dioscorea sansibarensis]